MSSYDGMYGIQMMEYKTIKNVLRHKKKIALWLLSEKSKHFEE